MMTGPGITTTKDLVVCSQCKKTSDEVNIWFPTPVKDTDAETQRIKAFAKCEYCIFGIPYS